MSIKNTAVSSILGLMFLSLLVIYLISAPSMLITFLSVLIMLVGLIMAQSSSWRDIGILAAVAVIISMVAVALVASARLGSVGIVIALVLWGLLLWTLFSSARRSIMPLPRDRAILIRNLVTGQVHRADGPIVGPNVPFMERLVAVVPLYELFSDVRVEKINTRVECRIDDCCRSCGVRPPTKIVAADADEGNAERSKGAIVHEGMLNDPGTGKPE